MLSVGLKVLNVKLSSYEIYWVFIEFKMMEQSKVLEVGVGSIK